MIVTDAQVHLWLPDHPDRPWPPGGREYAHRASYEPAELLADMTAAGVDRAVVIPPSFEGDRNDFCLSAAGEHPDRLAVMGRIALADPASRRAVPSWLEQPGMLGFRVTFGRGLALPPDDPSIRWFWQDVARHDVPVMVSVAAYLDRLPRILDAQPGLRLVIDRLGVPHAARGREIDAALDRLCALAAYHSVAVKATGLPEMAAPGAPLSSVHRHLHRALDVFGPRRVFFASDLTRMPCDYSAIVAVFRDVLSSRDAGDAEWVLGKGVSSYLRW